MAFKLKRTDERVKVLHTLQRAGFNAIIAGGAIRDDYHDVMYSDVDIFIKSPFDNLSRITDSKYLPYYIEEDWMDYFKDLFQLKTDRPYRTSSDSIEIHSENSGSGGLNTRVNTVLDVMKNFTLYQFIFINDMNPVDYVDTHFDFGICKAYFDGYKARFTPDFMRDSRNRTITMVNPRMSRKSRNYAMTNHLPRIKAKYPGYKLIEPIHLT